MVGSSIFCRYIESFHFIEEQLFFSVLLNMFIHSIIQLQITTYYKLWKIKLIKWLTLILHAIIAIVLAGTVLSRWHTWRSVRRSDLFRKFLAAVFVFGHFHTSFSFQVHSFCTFFYKNIIRNHVQQWKIQHWYTKLKLCSQKRAAHYHQIIDKQNPASPDLSGF